MTEKQENKIEIDMNKLVDLMFDNYIQVDIAESYELEEGEVREELIAAERQQQHEMVLELMSIVVAEEIYVVLAEHFAFEWIALINDFMRNFGGGDDD